MEIVKIGGYEWQKYKGSEGQDVYVAMFLEDQDGLLGHYATDESYDILIDNDADFYLPPECDILAQTDCNQKCIGCIDESRVAFKFRKNVFSQEEQMGAYEGLYGAAVESNTRGLAAGPREESQGNRDWVSVYQQKVLSWYIAGQPSNIDGSDPIEQFAIAAAKEEEIRGGVWLRTKVEPEFGDYKNFFPKLEVVLKELSIEEASKYAKKIKETFISDTSYATAIWSGIAGFYGRYPRIPYGRPCAYTDHNRETFEKCYPFARKLENSFETLLPSRHSRQAELSSGVDKKFLIGEDTTFTTITVNTTTEDRNARMACHRDAGSLNEGFSNLTVISDGKSDWKGGYLVTPEVRAAINVRPGDLLLIDNMRIIHGNTPIESPDEGNLMRMSLVFYFREDMMKLGTWEYEHLRRAYVDDRRKNVEHQHWRPYWNGVSPSMWDEQEWYDWLSLKGGEDMVLQYHPESVSQEGSLDEFFG
jgi:hypothetical protein